MEERDREREELRVTVKVSTPDGDCAMFAPFARLNLETPKKKPLGSSQRLSSTGPSLPILSRLVLF
jgi:hypothetical protein